MRNSAFHFLGMSGGHPIKRSALPRPRAGGVFSYDYGELTVPAGDAILRSPGQRVICDSSVFSPVRIDLVRRLLVEHGVELTPEALLELQDLKRNQRPETAPLVDLLFPDGGDLNPLIRVTGFQALTGFDNVLTYYVNLLLARKLALETRMRDIERAEGPAAATAGRPGLTRELASISHRTVRLANKGDARKRRADETAAAHGVLHGVITGQPTVLLTFDNDVFEQFFKLTTLLFDDYASMLLAEDLFLRPERYPTRHSLAGRPDIGLLVDETEDDAFAFERDPEPWGLYPRLAESCIVHVMVPDTPPQFLSWCASTDLRRLMEVKRDTGGRNTTRFGTRNVYGNLRPTTPRTTLPRGRSYGFVIQDRLNRWYSLLNRQEVRISIADVARTLHDVERVKFTQVPTA